MKLIILLLFSVLPLSSFAQTAGTFFPSNPGYKWYFKTIPMDSLNQPQEQFAAYRVDSFSVVQNYKGMNAHYIPSKRNLANINQSSPYLDTTFLSFNGTNAWEYYHLTYGLDSIPFLDSLGIIEFLESMESWYQVYRFAQAVNTSYTILSKDTTIQVDTLTLPLRFAITGRRLNDQTINTVAGSFLAKKFVITYTLSYLISFPPLPPIPVPVVARPDTSYIVSDIWLVKSAIPSVNVDLTGLGIPVSFYIPGQVTELFNPATSVSNYTFSIPEEFSLHQNYPNPFNPVTVINYQLPAASDVKLTVYDMLGRKINMLVNGKQNAGIYSITFDGTGFASGIYYYTLTTESFTETKKMMLVK